MDNLQNITQQLCEQMQRGNVVLFIGSRLDPYVDLPSEAHVLRPLASQIDCPPDRDPVLIAQFFENARGRHALIQCIREMSEDVPSLPGLLQKVVQIPAKIILTTHYNLVIERCLEQRRISFNRVMIGTDIPFWDSKKVQLVKLRGSLDRPESLVITKRDIEHYHRQHEQIVQQIRGLAMTHTFLFVGYDPYDPIFSPILTEVTQDLKRYRRQAYIIGFDLDEFEAQDLETHQVKVVLNVSAQTLPAAERDLMTLLDTLIQLKGKIEEPPPPVHTTWLTSEVKELFSIMGYRVSSEGRGRTCHYLLCQKEVELLSRRVLVICVEGETEPRHILEAQTLLSQHRGNSLRIVSQSRISPAARQLAQDLKPSIDVRLLTYNEFYRLMIDFDEYLLNLVKEYEQSNLHRYYVDLGCNKMHYDADGNAIGEDAYKPIDNYIDTWLQEKGRNHLSILGDFGSGKTWLCQHLAYRFAIRYLESPNPQQAGLRIPILIRLRDYSKNPHIRQLITDLLVNQFKIPLVGGYEAFEKANRDGRLLLIFDGFDEMEQHTDYLTAVQNFFELAQVIQPASKVLLTCRTAYFRTDLERREVLSGPEQVNTQEPVIDLRNRPNFEVVYLQDFTQDDIKLALQKRSPRTWEATYHRIETTYDLMNLAQRPILLEMMAESLPEMSETTLADVTTLYEVYTNRWIQKNIDEDRTFTRSEDKLALMEELAIKMHEQDVLELKYESFPAQVRTYFQLEDPTKLAQFEHDIRTQSFLVRDASNVYRFAHRSFQEFFASKRLAKEIAAGKPDLLQIRPLSPEILNFLSKMEIAVDQLWRFIDLTRNRSLEEVGYIGGNALTLLHRLEQDLRGRDFSKTVLPYTNLESADLTESSFYRANLTGTNLNYSTLRDTDFRFAEVENVSVFEASLIRALALCPVTQRLICSGGTGEVLMWDLDNLETAVCLQKHRNAALCLSFSHDGRFLASGGFSGEIMIWDFSRGAQIVEIAAHTRRVNSLVFAPYEYRFFSVAEDFKLNFWRLTVRPDGISYSLEQSIPGAHDDLIRKVCYSRDGTLIATSSNDGRIKLWNAHSGELVDTLAGHNDQVNNIAFSPDGQFLASSGGPNDPTVRLWDVRRLNQVACFEGHVDHIWGLAYHPSGRYIASGSSDSTIRIWDTQTIKQVLSLEGHDDVVLEVVYHRDGDLLASCGNDGRVKLWHPLTGASQGTLTVPGGRIDCTNMKIMGIRSWNDVRIERMKRRGAIAS